MCPWLVRLFVGVLTHYPLSIHAGNGGGETTASGAVVGRGRAGRGGGGWRAAAGPNGVSLGASAGGGGGGNGSGSSSGTRVAACGVSSLCCGKPRRWPGAALCGGDPVQCSAVPGGGRQGWGGCVRAGHALCGWPRPRPPWRPPAPCP